MRLQEGMPQAVPRSNIGDALPLDLGAEGGCMTNTPVERDDDGAWVKLRRRKVVQWGLAYCAAAWALVQVVGFAADAFHWQDTVKQLSMVVAGIGFAIIVTLAWYHGDRGEQRVTRVELAVLTLLMFFGGGLLWFFGSRGAHTPSTVETTAVTTGTNPSVAQPDPRPSIAVLPFVNMSADKEQEYFSDGLSEQMLDLLSNVPQLRVIARTSSFSFKGRVSMPKPSRALLVFRTCWRGAYASRGIVFASAPTWCVLRTARSSGPARMTAVSRTSSGSRMRLPAPWSQNSRSRCSARPRGRTA